MKKTNKPATNKPAQKKPSVKKSAAKPKRKAQGGSQLSEITVRLAAIANQLAQTAERLATLAPPIEIREDEVVVASVAPQEEGALGGPVLADTTEDE